jgi:predicted DNA-binding protein
METANMPAKATKRLGLNLRASLYDSLTQLAKDSGQTKTHLLEQAVAHYIQFVAPTETTVRPEIMAQVRRSISKNHRLLKLLAK